MKCQLRTDTILYSCKKAKANKRLEKDLKKFLQDFEEHLSSQDNISDIEYQEYNRSKADWESHITRVNSGIILRSKAQWVEDGDKNTKYFLNLEKRNFNNTCIKTLFNKDNNEVTDMEQILQEQKLFYENLYTSKIDYQETDMTKKYFTNNNMPKLSETDKDMCDMI